MRARVAQAPYGRMRGQANLPAIPTVFVVLSLGSAHAAGLTEARLRALPIILDNPAYPADFRQLQPLGRYMRALRRAKHWCKLDTFDYGGTLVCHTAQGRTVLISIQAVPTRIPDFAHITQIRPDGANSRPLAFPELVPFLSELARMPDKVGRRARD